MLAAPLLIAFLDCVAGGDIGPHAGGHAHLQLPALALAMAILPYSFDALSAFHSADPAGHLRTAWANIGGNLPTSVMVLALPALGFPGCDGANAGFALGSYSGSRYCLGAALESPFSPS